MENNLWYKMDNVAKVFLATYNKRDTRSFRLTCTLKEEVDPKFLQQALELTASERPQYQVEIHRGLFWHYMEVSEKCVEVREEFERPCPLLMGPDRSSPLHYSLTYWGKRINLEMFHALTDGTGGLEFLNIIVQNYLKLKHPEELKNLSMYSGADAEDLAEDSFRQFYSKEGDASAKSGEAYHIKSVKLPYNQQQFFEAHMSTKEVLTRAKSCGATMTAFLGASLAMAIYEDMPGLERKRGKPVTISMPVNLRNFYPSATSRNFFNSIYISHVFRGDETLEELAHEFDRQLKEEITPERVKARMDNYEKLEYLMLVRVVPLFLKNPVVKFFTKKEQKSVSATVSNVGKIVIPEEIKPYIDAYAGYCSTEKLFVTIVSYGDDLTFGIASTYRSTSVLKSFIRSLTEVGIEVRVEATDVIRY